MVHEPTLSHAALLQVTTKGTHLTTPETDASDMRHGHIRGRRISKGHGHPDRQAMYFGDFHVSGETGNHQAGGKSDVSADYVGVASTTTSGSFGGSSRNADQAEETDSDSLEGALKEMKEITDDQEDQEDWTSPISGLHVPRYGPDQSSRARLYSRRERFVGSIQNLARTFSAFVQADRRDEFLSTY